MDAIEEIREELREIKKILLAPAPRPDDLVDAAYIAARTGLAERTVREGKAGTKEIPRVELKSDSATRSLVRFPRAAADKWIRDLVTAAAAKEPRQRALQLISRNHRRSRRA
jgi:hypothetical protein